MRKNTKSNLENRHTDFILGSLSSSTTSVLYHSFGVAFNLPSLKSTIRGPGIAFFHISSWTSVGNSLKRGRVVAMSVVAVALSRRMFQASLEDWCRGVVIEISKMSGDQRGSEMFRSEPE